MNDMAWINSVLKQAQLADSFARGFLEVFEKRADVPGSTLAGAVGGATGGSILGLLASIPRSQRRHWLRNLLLGGAVGGVAGGAGGAYTALQAAAERKARDRDFAVSVDRDHAAYQPVAFGEQAGPEPLRYAQYNPLAEMAYAGGWGQTPFVSPAGGLRLSQPPEDIGPKLKQHLQSPNHDLYDNSLAEKLTLELMR